MISFVRLAGGGRIFFTESVCLVNDLNDKDVQIVLSESL